jgi:type IV secretion system protein VirB1
MILDPAAVVSLAARCAPAVAPATLLALARVESGLNPLAIGVNHSPAKVPPPRSTSQAIELATSLTAAGENVDLGLAQINSANLKRLGLTIKAAFDPCRNLAAGATILRTAYAAARQHAADDQAALRAALSIYNTGDHLRGLRNGYVARVVMSATGVSPNPSRPTANPPPTAVADHAKPRRWDVFGELSGAGFVFSPAQTQGAPL